MQQRKKRLLLYGQSYIFSQFSHPTVTVRSKKLIFYYILLNFVKLCAIISVRGIFFKPSEVHRRVVLEKGASDYV